MHRRLAATMVMACSCLFSGCFTPWFAKDKEPAQLMSARREAIKEKLQSEQRPTIVSEIASPAMLTQSRLQNIGLVTRLYGTGGAVNASQQREKMLDSMRRNETNQPNRVLDDESTAMVVATVVVPPAARKGSSLDVAVHLSTHANATDLEHGWLMSTPLMEMNRLGGEVREGFERTAAAGQVVTRFQMTGDDEPRAKLDGVVVGGGRLLKERLLGISVSSEYADAITMSAIVPAINRRFVYFDGRAQKGVATPREDSYVEIAVPPKYQLDPFHFIQVVLQTAFNETEAQRAERMATLQMQLQEPTTVRRACWQLEAIGEPGIPMLASALTSEDPEIRFYAAHSLAYLDDPRAIPKLVSLCMQEPAFRAMCLNGLTVLESYEAEDALRELLHAASPEVRYGAVRAIRERDAADAEVAGVAVGETGSILEIPSSGPPLVAVSLSEIPEVVIFGDVPQLRIPAFQYVNSRILVSPSERGGLTISHFKAGEDDQVVQVAPDLASVLAGISEVGGTYGDWVRFIRECHEAGYLSEPIAMNPVPQAGRTYERKAMAAQAGFGEPGDEMVESTILPMPADESNGSADSRSESTWFNPFTWGQ